MSRSTSSSGDSGPGGGVLSSSSQSRSVVSLGVSAPPDTRRSPGTGLCPRGHLRLRGVCPDTPDGWIGAPHPSLLPTKPGGHLRPFLFPSTLQTNDRGPVESGVLP